ncbi:MAG: HAD family phosphatase [Caldilineales bacterium]|nr:HAD family phosphatase [Caldilineales bacterium]
MTIRLIACDLDGTLAHRSGYISPESIQALQRARAAGILVVLATGRMPGLIGPFLDQLGFTDEPIIAAQGALVAYRDGRVVRRLTLNAALAADAGRIAAAAGAGMAYYSDDRIFIDRLVFPADDYENWFGDLAVVHPEIAASLPPALIKFMAIHPDPEAVPGLMAAWQQHFDGQADITRSWDNFVEGTAPGADKGAALAWLCRRLGIAQEETLAIGDGGNDVTMLRWAGRSAAPASGDPAALAVAKWMAPPIEEHPVAATLERVLGW